MIDKEWAIKIEELSLNNLRYCLSKLIGCAEGELDGKVEDWYLLEHSPSGDLYGLAKAYFDSDNEYTFMPIEIVQDRFKKAYFSL